MPGAIKQRLEAQLDEDAADILAAARAARPSASLAEQIVHELLPRSPKR